VGTGVVSSERTVSAADAQTFHGVLAGGTVYGIIQNLDYTGITLTIDNSRQNAQQGKRTQHYHKAIVPYTNTELRTLYSSRAGSEAGRRAVDADVDCDRAVTRS
jgi:hypothetical protein